MQNLEIKARYKNLSHAESLSIRLGAKKQWTRLQKDIYFNVPKGKLKLRLVQDLPGDLIYYERPDNKDAEISNYFIYSSQDPASLQMLLEKFADIIKIVEKRRTLLLYKNTRIHLDDVKNLGPFIEFEAVMGPEYGLSESIEILNFLEKELKITEHDKIDKGYFELLN